MATVVSSISINNLTIVQSANLEYARLLSHSILFYEAQRSGKLPSNNRIAWRHDSALTDGSDVQLDLTGGYYDAGDYLKFTFPLSYTAFMLSWGGIDYYKGYELANQASYLREQVKWATDWMIKAHPSKCTLYVQIGDVRLDNNYFGPDTNIPLPRPSYQINETNFGTDVASMTAAAFATASSLFRMFASVTGDQKDAAYADLLLSHGVQLYSCSKTISFSRYQFAVPTVKDIYASTDYLDDLILSAISLYKATKNETYLNDALSYYQLPDWRTNHTEPLGWDNTYGAVYVLLAESLFNTSDPQTSIQSRKVAENYLDGIVSGTSVNQTKGGLLFWDFYSDDNSNANAMSASYLLLSYSRQVLRPLLAISPTDQVAISAKIKRYEDLAIRQLNYMFGMNPINQNYIVGERPNSPKYPHSALAAGFNSLADAIASPTDLSHSHTIYGALVGGPAKNDSFADQRLDWSQTEVALDYNACYQGILAYQAMYSPNGPYYETPTSSSNPTTAHVSNALPTWAIVIAIIFPILAACLLGLLAFMFIRRRRQQPLRQKSEPSTRYESDEGSTLQQDGSPKDFSQGSPASQKKTSVDLTDQGITLPRELLTESTTQRAPELGQ
ncbi:hypothetical protein CU097_002569 [Rhizopus azygosporus]|uniref:Endoglucanase n=1 Tax=Rhizopus azygosporus TaxID=86630 RepID=A0A367JAX2_RHIAZ|nr:hypothetical protein CU097_002569 [Rhizopus azygosporus]